MIHSKYGLLTNPSLFDFLHEKLITQVPLSIAIIGIYRYADTPFWFLFISELLVHI